MPRSTHPISVKEHDSANFYLSLTLIASSVSSILVMFTDLLIPLSEFLIHNKIPLSAFVPTTGTIYYAILKAWNLGVWKIFKYLKIIDLPNIDGTWFGKIWYERENKFGYGLLIIDQTYTKGFIKGLFESGINTDSQTIEFSAIDSAMPEIITNYHAQGISNGRGTAYLNIECNEGVTYLQGEFFTDITLTAELRTGYQVYMKVSRKKIWNLEGMRKKVCVTEKSKYENQLKSIDEILERLMRKPIITTPN